MAQEQSRPQPLQPAQPGEPRKEDTREPHEIAQAFTVSFMVETAEGFHAVITGDNIAGRDIVQYIVQTSKGLAQRQLKPVDRRSIVTIENQVAAGAAPTGGGRSNAPVEGSAPGDDSWIPKFCQDCGGSWPADFYDNRDDPPEGISPNVRCKKCKKTYYKPRPAGAGRPGRRS